MHINVEMQLLLPFKTVYAFAAALMEHWISAHEKLNYFHTFSLQLHTYRFLCVQLTNKIAFAGLLFSLFLSRCINISAAHTHTHTFSTSLVTMRPYEKERNGKVVAAHIACMCSCIHIFRSRWYFIGSPCLSHIDFKQLFSRIGFVWEILIFSYNSHTVHYVNRSMHNRIW